MDEADDEDKNMKIARKECILANEKDDDRRSNAEMNLNFMCNCSWCISRMIAILISQPKVIPIKFHNTFADDDDVDVIVCCYIEIALVALVALCPPYNTANVASELAHTHIQPQPHTTFI